MRVFHGVILVALSYSILGSPRMLLAKPTAANPAQAELKTTYARLFRVSQEPDEENALRFLQDQTTSDWSSIDETGKRHSRAEQLQVTQDVVAGRASVTPPRGKLFWQIDKIILQGDVAIVRSHRQLSYQELDVTGKYGAKGKYHSLAQVVRKRDTWIKTANGWRWKLSEEGYPELSVDGKLQTS